MKLYKLEISIWRKEGVIDTTYGPKEFILKKLRHLWKNSENKEHKEKSIPKFFEQTEPLNLGFCIIFDEKEGNVLSINIEEIIVNDFPILKAYTNQTNHSLITIFPEDYIALQKIVEEELRDLDCADNIRICVKGDEQGELLYEWAYNSGCCGVFEKEVVVGNKTYKIGCNYGH